MKITTAENASASLAASAADAPELMGAEILVKALQAEGVKQIWGYPGGAVLYIYDALYKQDTIQHVLVRHEQAAVHAADGFARATGEVGVALGDQWSRCNERGDRYRNRLYGQHPDGDRHGPSAHGGHRFGRLPRVRHRRYHTANRQTQLLGERRGRACH